MKNILFISILILSVSACSNDLAVHPDYSPGWQLPVVKGIKLMDEIGLPIGIWGSPDYSTGLKNSNSPGTGSEAFLQMDVPYPNPSYGNFQVEFEISRISNVKIWVTPARWINEPISNYSSGTGGSVTIVNGSRAIEVLLDGSQELSPGRYATTLENGEDKIPQGFYRVFVQADELTLWRDIYIGYSCQDAPPGLGRYLNHCPDM